MLSSAMHDWRYGLGSKALIPQSVERRLRRTSVWRPAQHYKNAVRPKMPAGLPSLQEPAQQQEAGAITCPVLPTRVRASAGGWWPVMPAAIPCSHEAAHQHDAVGTRCHPTL